MIYLTDMTNHVQRLGYLPLALVQAGTRQIYEGSSSYPDRSPINRKMDVGVMACYKQSKTKQRKIHKPKSDWAQMLVAGELKSNPIEDGQEPAWLGLSTLRSRGLLQARPEVRHALNRSEFVGRRSM